MKNTISIFGIIMVMSSLFTGSVNASMQEPKGTIYNPFGDNQQCHYELYCNRGIGEVGIAPEHVIMDRFGKDLGWDSFRFSNKNPY